MKLKKSKKQQSEVNPELGIEKSFTDNLKEVQLLQSVSQTLSFKQFPENWTRVLSCQIPLKGTVYPTFLSANEEYHLPLSGQEHWVVCVSGQLNVVERMSGQVHSIRASEWVRISRKSSSEYPNLKIISPISSSKALWIIGHKI